jgi:hypothetical protein
MSEGVSPDPARVEASWNALGTTFQLRRGVLEQSRMEPLFIEISQIARMNYLYFFTLGSTNPITRSVPISTIISIFQQYRDRVPIPKSSQSIRNATLHQTLSSAIKIVYHSPQKCVPGIAAFFAANPDLLPIFAHLTFPALFGFFTTQDVEDCAHSFLVETLHCDDPVFRQALLLSFFMSSTLFLQEFWRALFNSLSADRFHPSLGGLFEVLKDSFSHATQFLSNVQMQIAFEYSQVQPREFFECFFIRYVLESCDSFLALDRTTASLKITRAEIQRIFAHIDGGFCDPTDDDNVLFNELMMCFPTNTISSCEVVSYTSGIDRAKYVLLISPYEEMLLEKVFHTIPILRATLWDYTKLRPEDFLVRRDSLSCFLLDIFQVHKLESDARLPLQFGQRDRHRTEEVPDYDVQMKAIQVKSAAFGLNELPILLRWDVAEETDTFHQKLIKSEIVLTDRHFTAFVLQRYDNMNVESEGDFEQYYDRLEIAECMEDVRSRLLALQTVFERTFVGGLIGRGIQFDRGLFPEAVLRLEMSVDETEPHFGHLRLMSESFTAAIEAFFVQDRDFHPFLIEQADFVSGNRIGCLDALKLGDRLFVITDLFAAVKVLCKNNREWMFGLIANIFMQSHCNCLLETFLAMFKYVTDNKELAKKLSKNVIEVLNAFRGDDGLIKRLLTVEDHNGRQMFPTAAQESIQKFMGIPETLLRE